MIRRSPTRIELKLDDIQEFDYVHYDKKKTAQTAENAANISAATAAKLLRHERIGYHRAEANMARRTGGPPLGNPTTTVTVSGPETPAPVTTTSQPSSSAAAATAGPVTGGVTATSTPLPASAAPAGTTDTGAAGAATSEPGNTATNNLDPANLPSEIEASDSIYMDLAEFNSTYASANMSMDET